MELLIIRHGRPVRTEPSPLPPDPELSAVGRAQADAVGAWLAAERIDAIYASPLRRAIETAEPLAVKLGMEIVVEEGLRELSFGEDSYIPTEEITADHPQAIMWDKVMADQTSDVIVAFRAQVAAAITGIADRHPGAQVAVFCHAGVANAAAAEVLGLSTTLNFDIHYTAISRIRVSRTGRRAIYSLNEQGHLRDM